ncbi:MAG: hypothetical protein V3S56_02950, partial [Gemmatimonadota bacterium]
LAIIPQMLIVNFKEFLARYYLFLVPLFGAGLGVCAGLIWQSTSGRSARWMLVGVASLAGLVGAQDAFKHAHSNLHVTDSELAGAVAAVTVARPVCETILTRKPHIPFYANCSRTKMPEVDSVDELGAWIRARSLGNVVYLYYGSQERRFRPGLAALADASTAPPWLQPVASSAGQDPWVLYLYRDAP